jgi:hypothetical protein
MRNTDATPEEQELLAVLHARMVLKIRHMPPPHAESHLYELGFMDMEHDGTTIYGIPTWFPKAETKAWEEARFRPRWHEVGRA